MQINSGARPSRFFDGGMPGVPPDPAQPPRVMLNRVMDDRGREVWEMLRRIAYRDDALDTVIVVPDRLDRFRTDLTSVPRWFTWLVPKSGRHLQAALVHDALLDQTYDEPAYITNPPVEIDRVEADRIFRDGMRDTGTGVVRRWVAWSGVSVITLVKTGRPSWSPLQQWWFRIVVPAIVLAILYLGTCATLMVFDRSWPGFVSLPWMSSDQLWLQLLGGLAGAIAVPILMGLLTGPHWRAVAIAGVALATLLHVTVAVGVVALAYQAVEWFARRRPGLAAVLLVALVAAALLAFPILILL